MKNILLILLLMSTLLPQNRKAFINGKIYTVNQKQPLAECVIINDNKIEFVGSTRDAKKLFTKETEIIDLKGKLMLPGFIDNHVHFSMGGFYLLGIDLRQSKSTSEFINLIKAYSDQNPGKWITGGNWDHEAWENKNLPTKEMIDPVTANTPVFVERFDGHMGLANSLALKLAGITKETPNPEGGIIVKDPNTGEPTGILKDNAITLVKQIIPEHSEDEYYIAILTALEHAKQMGVTSVQDITYPLDLKTYQRLEDENNLTCRIFTRWPIDMYRDLIKKDICIPFGSEKLKLGSLKAFADGSLGSSTAWFFDKYIQDTTTCGLPMDIITNGSFEQWAIDADKHQLQLSTHAIGDRANAYVINLYEKIAYLNPKWDRRFRIEHAQHLRQNDIKRFGELGIIASVQPYHCIDDGVWAEKRIGKERLKTTYPFKSLIKSGAVVCFGSDWTVAPLNPILGIYAAVTRRTLDGKNPKGWIPEEKISVEDAIKCYTLNNAYASFEEDIKGSIEIGKLADFVVLDQDILTIKPENINKVKVLMTVFDGKIIYKK